MNAPLPASQHSVDTANGEPQPNIADHVLIRRIGKGAYGELWLARNVIGGFHAAKVIYRNRFSDSRPFEREFEGICKFEPISRTHAGLVTILQVGENLGAGYFYYVMELADDALTGRKIEAGSYNPRTLSQEMAGCQRLPLEKGLPISLSLTSALGYLHRQKLIHRDIKPSNIIFVNGLPKFADIGLMTEAGEGVSYVGSAGYMPPEGPGESTGDIYSLGKVFYGMFMGQPCKAFPELPGAAEEFTSTPALRQINDLILKACHHDPRQRFQTAEELYEALVLVTETVRGKSPGSGAALPARGVTAGKATTAPEGQPAASSEQQPKARWTRRAALLVVLLAIVGGGILAVVPHKGANVTDKVVALMDTPVSKGVYDTNNIDTGRSNADELYERLAGLDGILLPGSLHKEAIGDGWARDFFIIALKPDLVIIHRSSFFHPLAAKLKLAYPPFANPVDEKLFEDIYDAQDLRLRSFISLVGAAVPHCRFLIYSRGTDPNWLKKEFRLNWIATLESNLPTLQGRIQTMEVPNGKLGTFRDRTTMDEVRRHVREMLKFPQKSALEKRN